MNNHPHPVFMCKEKFRVVRKLSGNPVRYWKCYIHVFSWKKISRGGCWYWDTIFSYFCVL